MKKAVCEHGEAIRRYLRRIVRNPDDADEIAQQTVVRALRKATTLEDPNAIRAWLYRIATNLAWDHYRRSQRYRQWAADNACGEPQAAADQDQRQAFERGEMSACVQSTLTELPDHYRAALLLHDAEGHTAKEIAAMLDWTLANTKVRIHRARAKLKKALQERCEITRDERGVLVCQPQERDG